MSGNVTSISTSLGQYQTMIGQSKESMDSIKDLLTGIQTNLDTILTATTIVLLLFFLWLLAAQVVIFSQGYELFHGTAGRMAGKLPEAVNLDVLPEVVAQDPAPEAGSKAQTP